ncbi:uncharacterized protein Z520_01034 [Fonsecaea multimorphosa CBS 102226]|uniref:SprT-like domain-containing protein n=1 Tax=Fonsecaea multimorphosa CBS 102226 TaxID=1442371 RepID=A0A0D2L0L2_9EURO|nr:uncharacterized protein Z520_01034 [Fonsecaea multimorphosa CBS 102226]KIY02569.1 hypothetical protein Z520_01034 [Fonsecaea multimorphosa CBS 102226]OAL31435.1 hypothetical protein AYO22_01027 [Fonsecaea multimorphosa]
MCAYSSEDDLPDLHAIFAPKPLMATGTHTTLRRSPRKKPVVNESTSPQKRQRDVSSPTKRMEHNGCHLPVKSRCRKEATKPEKTNRALLKDIPLLPRNLTLAETHVTSNNRRAEASPQRSLRLAHVDSLLIPLKLLAVEDGGPSAAFADSSKNAGGPVMLGQAEKPVKFQMREKRTRSRKDDIQEKKPATNRTCRFVLKEARCNDDDEESGRDDEEEDEDTDLSGFIVDDDAELSYYDSSASNSEDDDYTRPTMKVPQTRPRRRLHRGSPTRRRLSFGDREGSDKENHSAETLSNALRDIALGERDSRTKTEIQVIDLTSSPTISPETKLNTRPDLPSPQAHHALPSRELFQDSNPFNDFNPHCQLPPPAPVPALMIPAKNQLVDRDSDDGSGDLQEGPVKKSHDNFETPPATPPRSPSKLKSPSKLLSPSKRQVIPQSPHRQSMDAFWDHNVINEWNDEYSPKKAPATSPRKGILGRFQLWSDSEDEEQDKSFGSSDSLPSPCLSPRKSKSPTKSPEKEEKKRLAEEKRAAAARKKAFDSQKQQLARDLLQELDEKVADSQLHRLSSSTGGVRIIWSKTLRSTAGRANWKKTITKPSGSPVKGYSMNEPSGPGVNVQHFASIELAEKIIDCEDRLVNTLAHEFCHLTNFMISNVRDQPHGTSFKEWATKVTSHLRSTDVESWKNVQVTTKHNYAINHKYLWICVGRKEKTAAMDFLNLDQDEGCGAEYGRHSKSVDVEKHRCGNCKGRLVQVRPKPRASPIKKETKARGGLGLKREGSAESTVSSSSGSGPLGRMIETIELSE